MSWLLEAYATLLDVQAVQQSKMPLGARRMALGGVLPELICRTDLHEGVAGRVIMREGRRKQTTLWRTLGTRVVARWASLRSTIRERRLPPESALAQQRSCRAKAVTRQASGRDACENM
jgi:hypothetical protein